LTTVKPSERTRSWVASSTVELPEWKPMYGQLCACTRRCMSSPCASASQIELIEVASAANATTRSRLERSLPPSLPTTSTSTMIVFLLLQRLCAGGAKG